MNEVEFIPAEEYMLVAVHSPDGTITIHEMNWEAFDRLRAALER